MFPMILLWIVILMRLCCSEVVEEFTAVPNVMRLGHHYHDEKPEAGDFEQFVTSTIVDCLTNKVEAGGIDFIVRRFIAARGTPITSLPLPEPLPFEDGDALQISKMVNSCAAKLSNEPEGDLLDQLALVVYPPNYASGLNFGLRLEVRGYYSAARSVYEYCFRHSGHAGCGMHVAMATPVFASSAVHAQFVYLHVLRSFYRLLSPQSPVQLRPAYFDIDDAYDHIFSLLRDVPGNLQTLGYAPGRILELLSLAVAQHVPQLLTLHNFTQLATVDDLPTGSIFVDAAFLDERDALHLPFAYLPAPPLNPRTALRQRLQRLRQGEEQRRLREQDARPEHEDDGVADDGGDSDSGDGGGDSSGDSSGDSGEAPATSKRLRIGIFSESFANTSPGLCLQSVFRHLAVEFRATMALVFFDRDTMPTVFAHAMRDVAVRTVNIREDSVVATARLIAAEDLDVLVYLAVPTNKLAFLLAHTRLAAVQIWTGIGHPLTAGVAEGLDYVVVPADMLPQRRLPPQPAGAFSRLDTRALTARRRVDSVACAFEAHLCVADDDDTARLLHTALAAAAASDASDGDDGVDGDAPLLLRDVCGLSRECYEVEASALQYAEQLVVFSTMSHVMLDPVTFHRPDGAGDEARYRSMRDLLLPNGAAAQASDAAATAAAGAAPADERLRKFKEERRSDVVYHALRRLAQLRPVLPAAVTQLPLDYLAAHVLSCAQLDEIVRDVLRLHELHAVFFQSARDFGCYDVRYAAEDATVVRAVERVPPAAHFYYAVQFARKLQPAMDDVFAAVLARDPLAVVIVKRAYRCKLPLLARRYRAQLRRLGGDDAARAAASDDVALVAELEARFAFLPDRIPHEAYLGLEALSRVFLNTAPMGAGMTSAEALAMCVPLVTLPAETNVLRFADAQLKQIPTLTHDDLDAMVARNRSDYVEKALRFGRFGDADYAAIVALRDRLCDGVSYLFSDDGASPAASQEATDGAPDAGDASAIHHEDRVFRDDRRFKNSVRDVAHEWAQFLHRVSAS